MKKTTIVLTVLLALAPGLVAAQQGPPQPVPPAAPGQGWRQGVAPRAAQLRRGMMARRMALQGWMAGRQGRGFGMRGQAFGPGFGRGQGQGFAGRMQGPGFGRGQGQGFAGRMQGPGFGAGQPGEGPLGPLANPQIRQQLNLSDAQVKQLEELRASVQQERQQEMEQLRAERQKLMERVRTERQQQREQDRADRQKEMQELQASDQKLMQQRQEQQKQIQEKLQQLLTPEQRTKLEQLRAAPPQGPGMGPMGRGMGRTMMRPDSIK